MLKRIWTRAQARKAEVEERKGRKTATSRSSSSVMPVNRVPFKSHPRTFFFSLGVGKSSMVNNYINGNFATEYQVTIGLEFASKEITLQDGSATKIQIWDAAGQECFRSIVRSFYRNASAFIIVYNICEPKTFHNVQYWVQDAKEHQTENGIFILVGNQCDREDEYN